MRLAFAFLAGAGAAAVIIGHGLAAYLLVLGAPTIVANVLIAVGLAGTLFLSAATLGLVIEKMKKSGFDARRGATLPRERPSQDR